MKKSYRTIEKNPLNHMDFFYKIGKVGKYEKNGIFDFKKNLGGGFF